MWTRFNINDRVRVKLTERGREVLRINHQRRYGSRATEFDTREVKEDADGWSEWQMWDLMHEFGGSMYNGCSVPFETWIGIDASALGKEVNHG